MTQFYKTIFGTDAVVPPGTPEAHYEPRQDSIRHIVIHYTHGDLKRTMGRFTNGDIGNRVSAHYVIPQFGHVGEVVRVVPEDMTAWHAGKSWWRGQEDLNHSSIGIEIVCQGNITLANGRTLDIPYQPNQIYTVTALISELSAKYDVKPYNLVGHSDIAPTRRSDPGRLFPWYDVYRDCYGIEFGKPIHDEQYNPFRIDRDNYRLRELGYGVYVYGFTPCAEAWNEKYGHKEAQTNLYAVHDYYKRNGWLYKPANKQVN